MAKFAEFKDLKWKKFVNNLSRRINEVEDGSNKYVGHVGPIAFRDVVQHFESEQGPEGKWDRWSNSYRKFMEKIGRGGNNILQDTGRLRNSLQIAKGVKGKKGEIPILVNPAVTSNGFPYALHHDTGKSSSDGNPREFMWLTDKAMEKIADATLEFVAGDD